MKADIRSRCTRRLWLSGELAFTLTEMMVTMAIFLILVGGLVSGNLFGLRMFQVEQTKLIASDEARRIVGKLMEEIHSCETFQVGTVSTNGTFTGLAPGAPQMGPALIVYASTNATNFVVYYVNAADQKFRRATNVKGSTRVLAQSVTNATGLFRAQDYLGNLLTNMQVNTALHLKLEFYQAARFGVPPDYYKLETSATRR
jgi:prepilin-type N-terminal cleavage/methylation domain-containing protein